MSTLYSKEHEWITMDGNTATFGITDYAAEQLGTVIYIEVKEIGESFKQGDVIGVLESVKAASDIYSPADIEVTAVNSDLVENPETLNESPEDAGWIYKFTLTDKTQLDDMMDLAAYKAQLA